MPAKRTAQTHDPYAVLRIKDFRSFIGARFLLTFAIQMQSVIVGWQVYEITHDPLALGMIGLAEAIPNLSVALFAGFVADRFNRRTIVKATTALYILCAAILLIVCYLPAEQLPKTGLAILFGVIALSGLARAFYYPAQASYMAQIIPRELYPNSSTWNSTIWHIAAMAGPATGGLVYGFAGSRTAYGLVLILALVSLGLFFITRRVPNPATRMHRGLVQELKEGIGFVFRKQELLGALSLDMFAVLFGGAVALLPVFADQVLKVGPEGLGFLRAAPMVGAVLMSFLLAWYPPVKHSGWKLLGGVAGFGISIILFALSNNFWISMACLFFSGMFDNISVVIRHTIIQVYTPDEMRGRVASINSIFIGSSNEIGAFESGLAARLLGLIPSVLFGGGMTILIVALTARFLPQLRRMELKPEENTP